MQAVSCNTQRCHLQILKAETYLPTINLKALSKAFLHSNVFDVSVYVDYTKIKGLHEKKEISKALSTILLSHLCFVAET